MRNARNKRKIVNFVKERPLLQYSLYIVLTASLLCIAYFIIKNFDVIFTWLVKAIHSLLGALTPFIIGLIIAYLINPLVDFTNRKICRGVMKPLSDEKKEIKRFKRKRLLSVLLSYFTVILVIVALLYGFVALTLSQLVVESLPKLIDNIVGYAQNYEETIKSWVSHVPSGVLSDKAQATSDYILKWITNNFSTNSVVSTVTDLGGSVVNLLLGVVSSMYLVYDKDFFKGLWAKFLELTCKESTGLTINRTLSDVNHILSNFVKGIFIDAVIVAILSSVGLSIAGLKFAVFVGIFAGLCNVIPYFGPILGMIPAFLIGMLTGDFWHGVIAVLILLVVQQIDGQIIYPRVVGSSTGLHPLFVLTAVTIGGVYDGLVGMILAVPIAGIIKLFIQRMVRKREYAILLRKADKKAEMREKIKREREEIERQKAAQRKAEEQAEAKSDGTNKKPTIEDSTEVMEKKIEKAIKDVRAEFTDSEEEPTDKKE